MIRYKHSLENLAGDLESRYGKEDLFVQEVRVAITQVVTRKRNASSSRSPERISGLTARSVAVEAKRPTHAG